MSGRLVWTLGLFVFVAAAVTPHLTAQSPAQQERQRLAQQDRQRIMKLLGITSIPPGAQSSNPDTYDESKAEPFPALPHPLFMNDGRRVTSADMWWKQRRPEIVEDFEREVYGRTPKNTPRVRWEVTNTVNDGTTVTKTLVGHVDNSSYRAVTVDIQLTLTTPAARQGSRARHHAVERPVRWTWTGGSAAHRRSAACAARWVVAAAGARQRMGLGADRAHQHSGRLGCRPHAGDHRAGQQRTAAHAG